ncbi:anthranilate phosphoribosyltransferase [Micromonospora sp. NPDC051300]|uniref:anthranilate phosphoribosyltransferase n=1 Tax=Micromonospora sp. NPDC051300 TaxID=3364286 RepID=UPI003793E1A5
MHPAITALLAPRQPVDLPAWRSLWDALHAGTLRRGEAVALLASLATSPPDAETAEALLDSLNERREPARPVPGGCVNVVGTGGGPRTFNVSTAAAFVAAATGLPVVKTGARAYSGGRGAFDLLELLGVPLASDYDELAEAVDRHGLAFAGYFVYPAEVALLARAVVPLQLREVGRFVNVLGPVLAAAPATAQLTGVSDPGVLDLLRRLAVRRGGARVWFCTNDAGVDELTGFADDVLHPAGGPSVRLADLGLPGPPASLADLGPTPPGTDPVADFRDVLAGRRGPGATHVICLNAAAMRVVADPGTRWTDALATAGEAVASGAALDLLDRMRAGRPERHRAVAAGG